MTTHYIREVDALKRQILALGALVEEQLRKAVRAVDTRDCELAKIVIQMDAETNAEEVKVEEECLKLLALYQPVAADLRFIVAVMKINNDLERIGDLTVNIAERVELLAAKPQGAAVMEFQVMGEKVQKMLKLSIDSLVNLDARLAREVCAADDEVDELNRETYDKIVKSGIEKDPSPDNVSVMIHLLSVSRFLERIADHAANIAQDLIYMVEGKIVRHRQKNESRDKG